MRSLRRRLAVISWVIPVVLASAAATGDAPTAAAAAGAVTASAPEPQAGAFLPAVAPRDPNGLLDGVSCSAATDCVAVGSYLSRAGVRQSVIESWDGSAWAVVPTPDPSDVAGDELAGVSCTSPTSCMAVGDYTNPSGNPEPLAERWNGASWIVVPVPVPSGERRGGLLGVSCTAAAACTAVGEWTGGNRGDEQTLVETWNGSTWAVVASPNPSGARYAVLEAVSCVSTAACVATGLVDSSPFAEVWNGVSWRLTSVPSPSADGGDLDGVTCRSPTACTAVGYRYAPASLRPLVEAWDGSTWTIIDAPYPQSGGWLVSVSCPSASACLAVGIGAPNSTHEVPLAERWNGSQWRIVPTPNPAGKGQLNAVSCRAATVCTSVGYTVTANVGLPLAEQWDGSTWTVTATVKPVGGRPSRLDDVSCWSETACFAVGDYEVKHETRVLTERWNGTTWTIVPAPDFPGASYAELTSVSCLSASNCMAVGYVLSSNGYHPLAERWNGTKWTILATVDVDSARLGQVSCAPAFCMALGSVAIAGGRNSVLAERWNGTTWSIVATVRPSTFGLVDVSCVSMDWCTAAGAHRVGTTIRTLIEVWDGASWTVASAPHPTLVSDFYGVSCASTVACTAVGEQSGTDGGGDVPLIEQWNGRRWTVANVEAPPAGSRSLLDAVSCVTATKCTAVGGYANDRNLSLPFAATSAGGTWSLATTPRPPGSHLSTLAGISCPAAGEPCIAVGSVVRSERVPIALTIAPDGAAAQ